MVIYSMSFLYVKFEGQYYVFNRPGVAGAVLQTASSVIQSFIKWLFVKISLRRRHGPTVENGDFSHKIY